MKTDALNHALSNLSSIRLSGEQTLEVSEKDSDYANRGYCLCDSCSFLTTKERLTFRFLFWGILCPIIWISNIFIMLFGLFWKHHVPLRSDSFIQIFDQKIKVAKDKHTISELLDQIHLKCHRRLRQRVWSRIWYSTGAFLIYLIIIAIIVYGALLLPHKDKKLASSLNQTS
ncbi:uncharacterized protein PRCAT00000180001 [Priceomyces carsonii]|uniref:uncharacterized protein n=1 Tax=Priceomyces carsonii TaxID=28549 RepID=UPI002ED8FE30|nr:unnamed protein product [Priceomyces carsonii]